MLWPLSLTKPSARKSAAAAPTAATTPERELLSSLATTVVARADDEISLPGSWPGETFTLKPLATVASQPSAPSVRTVRTVRPRPQLSLDLSQVPPLVPPGSKRALRDASTQTGTAVGGAHERTIIPRMAASPPVDDSEPSEAMAPTDPRFERWLAALRDVGSPPATSAANGSQASTVPRSEMPLTPSWDRSERWREREEAMVANAWHLENALPRVAKVGLISSMKFGALGSGAYSLFLPWVIITYPFMGLFTPVVIAVLFGVSVGIGALAQEISRSLAVRRDRRREVPRYDVCLEQLVGLQKELQTLKRVRQLDLRETQQLKQLNALRLRYEGGFLNLIRQGIDAVIDGHAVPEMHLKPSHA